MNYGDIMIISHSKTIIKLYNPSIHYGIHKDNTDSPNTTK